MAGYPRKQNKKNSGQQEQHSMARSIDQLTEFEKFRETVLPKLQRLLMAEDKSAKDIISFAEKELAARTVTIALTEEDPKIALQAIKDLLDRNLGKAKETIQNTHRYENMSEADLERMIEQEKRQLDEDVQH